MGKQQSIGKGKVTPVQVAFIVDRFLSDNNFLQTRSSFRTEASHLISKSPVHEAPRSLLSLGDMLDEYICLKEQKLMLNQEKFRVHNLLTGMQSLMNSYNSSAPPPPLVTPTVVNKTPTIISRYSTPSTSQVASKRTRNSKDSAPPSKRTRPQPSLKPTKTVLPKSITQDTTSRLHITPPPSTKPTPPQASNVAKCLFNPAPQTPSPSPDDKPSTPTSTNNKTVLTPQFTSTNRTVITSETIQVSPMKQVSYYSIERNHCISSPNKRLSKRDHVKGRLDFDGSETTTLVNSETLTSDENTASPSEDGAFDFDLSNFDCLGADFNFTELLGDFDLGGFCQMDNGSSPDSLSGSPDTIVDVDGTTGNHELVSGMSSTMTEYRSEQEPGPNSVTSMKSITKCIKVFSPVKSRSPTGLDH